MTYAQMLSAIGAQAAGSYAPATTGTSVLKGNGSGGTTQAVAGTDYATPSNVSALLGSATPNMDGTASAGSASTAARSDHTHPTDTSRLAASVIGSLSAGNWCTSDGTHITCATSAPTSTVASGSITLSHGTAIASGACDSAIYTATASGVATTDVIIATFNASPISITGFVPGAMLTIIPYPTANTVKDLS